ncbi:MAG: TolC family protein [Gammaproteobacteria bacterium]|jgi:outer membrane protein TolC
MIYFRDTAWCPVNSTAGHRSKPVSHHHAFSPPPRARVHTLLVTLIALLIAAVPATGAPSNKAAATLSLEDAIAISVEDNPGLAEMRARAEAMAAIPPQAGTLPDPMVSLSALNFPTDTFDRDQEPMTQLQLGIEQSLPFPGKLELKERAAEYDADAAASNVEESRLSLIRNVKQTWWEIFYHDRALETVSRNQDLLRQFVQIAQTKYKVGEGLQQEVLLAQVELSRLFDRRIELQGMRRQQAARLNALLDRPANTRVILPEKVDEDLAGILPESQLYARAETARPLLEQRRQEIEAARLRHDYARRDRYPDFKLGAAYGFRDGTNPDGGSRPDFATLRLGMSLPLYAGRKQNKAVDQRTSELLQRQYALQDEWDKVRAEITVALADYQRASEQKQLFRTGIIPQARQSVASMLSGYQVNKVDFLNLVRSQITLYNYETQYWKSFSEANQALARLSAAVGGEVTE